MAEGIGTAARGGGLAFQADRDGGGVHVSDVAQSTIFSTGNLGRVQFWDRVAGKGKRRSGPEKDHPDA